MGYLRLICLGGIGELKYFSYSAATLPFLIMSSTAPSTTFLKAGSSLAA